MLKYLRNSIKNIIEYEKQMYRLNAMLGRDIEESNNKIDGLIIFARKEYIKKNRNYPGDHSIIEMLYNKIAEGYTLEVSINDLKKELYFH